MTIDKETGRSESLITRRQMLQRSLYGAAGLLLADGWLPRLLAATPSGTTARPALGKATAVIQIRNNFV